MWNLWKKNKKTIVLFTAIFVMATILRIYNLTVLPVFADEAIYIRWAQVMRAEEGLRFLPLTDGKQPLFMWIVIPFLKLFSDPLIAGRIVSVLSGLGTIVGVFILTNLLLQSKKAALLASFIFAISPFSVFFDRFALVDSMLAFFAVWFSVFLVVMIKKARLDAAMLSGFFLGGGLLTKSPALYFSALAPLSLILVTWPGKMKDRFEKLSVYVFLFSSLYLVSIGMYNILRLGPNFHMISTRNKDYVYPLSHIFTSPLDPFKPFVDRSFEYIWILGPSVIIIFLTLGVYFGFRRLPKETFLLAAWSFIPIFISSEFSKTMTARYIYFSMPFLFIIASFGVVTLYFNSKINKEIRLLLKSLVIIFVVHSLYLDYQILIKPEMANLPRSERSGYMEEWTSGYGIKEVSEYLKAEAKNLSANRRIIVGTEGYFGTLPDGLQIYLNDIPDITVIGVGLPIKEIPESLKESKNFGNKTYLVVNNTRFVGDPLQLELKLISEYPKAMKPDGSVEKLLFFEIE